MLIKTRGIVLRFVKYRESSIIATIYTIEKGIISVISNGVRSKNSSGKIALFQPLSLVELVIYFSVSKNISRVSEIHSYHPLHNLRQNYVKTTISIFITEILNKCLKEEESNPPFFNFIQNSIIHLNEQNQELQNFHLVFLIKLSLFLGFKPSTTEDFINHIPNSSFYNDNTYRQTITNLLIANYETTLNISNSERINIINDLLDYYKSHLPLGNINSLEILHEILQLDCLKIPKI